MSGRAVLFDVDDTLYDLQWPYRMAVHDVFQGRYDHDIDRIYLRHRVRTDEKFEEYSAGKMSTDAYFIFRNQKGFEDCGYQISREEALAVKTAYQAYQRKISMSDEMRELIRKLQEHGVLAGIVSNGVSESQWKKIETLRIPELIPRENIIVSGDVGYAKPHREIYDFACRKLGLNLADAWYVGDTYLNDIVGASRAGWRTIWLNKRNWQAGPEKAGRTGSGGMSGRGEMPDHEIRPDYTVHCEGELIDLISRIFF